MERNGQSIRGVATRTLRPARSVGRAGPRRAVGHCDSSFGTVRSVIAVALVAAVAGLASPAAALELGALWPWKSATERWAERVEQARSGGQLDAAVTLLDEAERDVGTAQAPLIRERGLVARDQGRLAEAADLFGRAADLDSESDARLAQAAALVTLQRVPEAVQTLSRAFEERSGALRGDAVLADERFRPLVGVRAYDDLIANVRAEQAGPLGRLLIKFDRLEEQVRTADKVLNVLGRWMAALSRLADLTGVPVLLLLALGIFVTFGINQLGVMRPPWPLLGGMAIASVLWCIAADVASDGKDLGLSTIAIAFLIVLSPWGVALGGRRAWARWKARRRYDPFAAVNVEHTMALLRSVLGHAERIATGAAGEQQAAHESLRGLAPALQARLAGQPPSTSRPDQS